MTWDISKCDECGDCLVRCQYVDFSLEEAKDEMRKLINGEPTTIAGRCVTCGACNSYCEKGADPFDLILQVQEKTGAFKAPDRDIAMMSAASKMPSEIIQGQPGRPVMSLCTMGGFIPRLFEGQLFEGMTYLKGGDYFCLIGWFHVGKESPVREGAQRVVNKLAETKAEEIVFFHDDCYALMTAKAEDYGIKVPFKPIHIIEYLRDYIKDHKDRVKKLDMKVAYQPSCASRVAWRFWMDDMLDELFELIGVKRVERRYDRVNGLCCGAPLVSADRTRANELKDRNIKDAKDAGASALVFTCPLCALNLRRRANEAGMEPFMLSNLCRLALGEELPAGGVGKK